MTTQQLIRILVVEDSPAQMALVVGLLRATGQFDVVGTATNGRDAIQATRTLRPQVVAMDIHLPDLDGYEATRRIMQTCPTPIVMISNSTGDAARRSLDALAAGALAVLRKPANPLRPESAAECAVFIRTLRLMAGVRVVTRHAPRPAQIRPAVVAGSRPPEVLAVAASTGGPAALQKVLQGLGKNIALPVLIVQHIATGFTAALVDWLAGVVPQPLSIVEAETTLEPGQVYFAADQQHLVVLRRGVAMPQRSGSAERYCPSADRLFVSVAEHYGANSIGVILTGMGDDGAQGLAQVRAAGAPTFGQDAGSCVVYGMPQAAKRAGAVAHELPIDQIAPALLSLINRPLTREAR